MYYANADKGEEEEMQEYTWEFHQYAHHSHYLSYTDFCFNSD